MLRAEPTELQNITDFFGLRAQLSTLQPTEYNRFHPDRGWGVCLLETKFYYYVNLIAKLYFFDRFFFA